MRPRKRPLYLLLLCAIISSFYSDGVFAQASWQVGTGSDIGWAMRKENPNDPYKRFFAIGIVGVPGYTAPEVEVSIDQDPDQQDFIFQTDGFNLVYVDKRFQRKNHFKNHPILSGWSDTNYLWARFNDSTKGFTNQDEIITYEEMFNLRNRTDNYFANTIAEYVIDPLKTDYIDEGFDLVWFLYDEPDRGAKSWTWAPNDVKRIHDQAKNIAPGSITFLGLGPVEGSLFLLEDYLETQNLSLPPVLSQDSFYGDGVNYCTYVYTANGEKLLEWNGALDIPTCERRPSVVLTEQKIKNNVKTSIAKYGPSADVIGLNSYGYFNQHPRNVGIVMEAIREVRPNQPVWLFFQASYKDETTTYKELRCQIFTSIIHGATGALFYAYDDLNPDDFWYGSKAIAKELEKYQSILTAATTASNLTGEVRYIVKTLPDGSKHLIATNLGNTIAMLAVTGFPTISIEPLEVVIYPHKQNLLGLFSNGVDYTDKAGLPIYNPTTSAILDKNLSQFDISAVKFMTTGDFNGDNKDDVVLFYKQDTNSQKVIILHSEGNGQTFTFKDRWGRIEPQIVLPNDAHWLNTPNSFDFDAVKFVTTGDFNGDGKDDLVVFYRQNENEHKVIILHANNAGTGFEDRWGRNENTPNFHMPLDCHWLNTPNSFEFEAVKFVTTGDFDGNGKDDLVVFYRQNEDMHKIIVLHANDAGNGFEDRWGRNENTPNFHMPLDCHWLNTPNSFEFEVVKFVTAGDFDGNGKDDLVVFYLQNEDMHKIIVLHANDAGTGFEDRWGRNENTPNFHMPLDCHWLNTPNSFEFDAIRAVTSGDFDGNGKEDLIVFYNQTPEQQKIILLTTNDAGNAFEDRWGRNELTPGFHMPLSAYLTRNHHTSFDLDHIRFISSADLNGDNKGDLVILYDSKSTYQDQLSSSRVRIEETITSVDAETNAMLEIFPNPTDGVLYFDMKGNPTIHKVEVLDVRGMVVISENGSQIAKGIDLSTHPGGLYIIKIYMREQIVAKKVFLK